MKALLFLTAFPALAAEPPGAWFLNAHHTGSDPYVYFSVGGSGETPPLAPDEVVLGWSWDEAGTPVEPYPGKVPVRYRTSDLAEKRPVQWRDKSSRVGHPPLAIGPGGELVFLGDDARTTATALAWAELLDVVEAAYRHSSPDLAAAERGGELAIGLLGDCPIRSRPVEGEGPGWATLSLPGRARPSRAGGFYYVEDTRAPADRMGTVEVRRFLRRVEGPDCSGDDLDLRLFPAPRGDRLAFAYFLIWKDADVLSAGLLDLEPEPMTPAVRRAAGRARRTPSERANVGRWPDEGRDLCRDPVVGELCRRDLALRRRLATSLGPAGLPAAREQCRQLLRSLGAAGDPCSDPRAWNAESGLYLAGYRGDLPLVAHRLESRTDARGSVSWVWLDRVTREPVDFGLADGTRIRLSLPGSPPPDVLPLDVLPPEDLPAAAALHPRPAASAEAKPSDRSDRSDPSDRSDGSDPSDRSDPSDIGPAAPSPAAPSPAAPSPAAPSPAALLPAAPESVWAVKGLPRLWWPDPRLLVGAPAVLFVLLAVFRLRRSASRPRPRTSYVLRVSHLSAGETLPEQAGTPLADLPLAPAEKARPLELAPAVDSWESVSSEATPEEPATAEESAAAEEPPPALEATRRLAEWVASVLPVFRDVEEGRGGVRFESLPLPARREWIDAHDSLRRFAKGFLRRPLGEDAVEDPHGSPDRRLLGGDGSAPVQGAVLALQYLLEAFPVEQLDVRERKAYKTAVRERLELAGISPRFHELVADVAEALGLTYRAVRYYKSEIGEAGLELLDDACDPISLSERVGYEAGTERPVVVRLTELLLADAATGARFSGRAAIDGGNYSSTFRMK